MIAALWCLLSLWLVIGAYLPDWLPTWGKILVWWPVTFVTLVTIKYLTDKKDKK